jgi:DNA-binding transcriptional MerR regulator
MNPGGLLGIGDVARMYHISISSLRYYEKIGILKPERIDPDSGYRYYGSRQFEVLNSIRYLRTLDMPLSEIADFLRNRDIDNMVEKLREQKKIVLAKEAELRRVERKIDNRLKMIEDARHSILDTITVCRKPPCLMIWIQNSLRIKNYLDVEKPLRQLDQQAEAVIFLGKVGVSISSEHLGEGVFDRYDGIFLLLDEVDRYDGEVTGLPETLCVSVRFQGTHPQAPEQYRRLMAYTREHGMAVDGFSREITMIDYGLTGNTDQFVTEISIPVRC